MRCPVCDGSGRVAKRFLLFFMRRATCARCLGTGEFPPRPIGRLSEPTVGFESGTTESRDRDDDFAAGSGGRSGGGGGGASWGSTTERDAPVIVDPFTDQRSSTVGTASTEAMSTDQSGASAGDDSAPAGSGGGASSEGSGPAY